MDLSFVSTLLIRIPLAEVYDEVDVRTFYQGEMLKRKDADMAGIQTSSDDRVALRPFVETAVNHVAGTMVKRLTDVKWGILPSTEGGDCISMDMLPYRRIPEKDAGRVAALLRKSVLDYVSNYCVYEWLLTVRPELAAVPERRNEPLMWQIVKYTGMLGGMIRRRPTDLAGV